MSKLHLVIVGGPVVFDPVAWGEVLKGSCFYLSYDEEKETASLFHNNGAGGRTIMEIRNVSHESVAKLAEGMGLKPDKGEPCRFWSKNILIIHLYHDGSEDAEKIRLEACRLNIECRVTIIKKGPWILCNSPYQYNPDSWPVDKVIEEMKVWAERWGLKSYLCTEKIST